MEPAPPVMEPAPIMEPAPSGACAESGLRRVDGACAESGACAAKNGASYAEWSLHQVEPVPNEACAKRTCGPVLRMEPRRPEWSLCLVELRRMRTHGKS